VAGAGAGGASEPRLTGREGLVVEESLRIRARPETVWRYWTEPHRMSEWWGASAELDPRPGGMICVELEFGGVMRGKYVTLEPFERIVFTFGWEPTEGAPDVAPGSTRVEVNLTEDGGDTILTLRHTGIPTAERDTHRSGWGHFLPLLARAAAVPTDEEAPP
jgi:uncharacterized protein YndB with AHSA1/START domain